MDTRGTGDPFHISLGPQDGRDCGLKMVKMVVWDRESLSIPIPPHWDQETGGTGHRMVSEGQGCLPYRIGTAGQEGLQNTEDAQSSTDQGNAIASNTCA